MSAYTTICFSVQCENCEDTRNVEVELKEDIQDILCPCCGELQYDRRGVLLGFLADLSTETLQDMVQDRARGPWPFRFRDDDFNQL